MPSIPSAVGAVGGRIVEQGRIDVDPEPPVLRDLDCGHGLVVNAVFTYRRVMFRALAVEVDREGEKLRRLEQIELLFQQQGIGAQIDVFLALDQFRDYVANFPVDQRFAAGD